jgi:hypothetical protein
MREAGCVPCTNLVVATNNLEWFPVVDSWLGYGRCEPGVVHWTAALAAWVNAADMEQASRLLAAMQVQQSVTSPCQRGHWAAWFPIAHRGSTPRTWSRPAACSPPCRYSKASPLLAKEATGLRGSP